MRKSLTTIGSDVAIILDASLRDAIKLRANEMVEVEVRGDTLVLRRAQDLAPHPIADAFQQIVEHPEELRSGAAHPQGAS